MKIKKRLIPILATLVLGILSTGSLGFPEIIEKIYAVVNGELITYSELKNTEMEMTRVLAQQYEGDELAKQIEELKKNLLERLIEQKIILSYAKEKNYDVDGEVELLIKDVKKQNNIATDEELKRALASQGLGYEQWKKSIKESRMQQKFIYETIGTKIKIDSSAIMQYYRQNIKDYTLPLKLTLNCIFLGKTNYPEENALKEKMEIINAELKTAPFAKVAPKYTELPGGEILLGEFKQGELDPQIETAALKLKTRELSGWIKTETGWYILELVKRVEPQLVEYKTVRSEIENKLMQQEQGEKIEEYLKELRKESHIKIYEKF